MNQLIGTRSVVGLVLLTCSGVGLIMAQDSPSHRDGLRFAFAQAYQKLGKKQGSASSEPKPPGELTGPPQELVGPKPESVGTAQRNRGESGGSIKRISGDKPLDKPNFVNPRLARLPPAVLSKPKVSSLPSVPFATPDVYSTPGPRQPAPQQSTTVQAGSQSEFWWEDLVAQPMDTRPTEEIFVERLIELALLNAPRILAISQTPLIQETEVGEAQAEFDPELFVRSQFDDRVDPVGNTLTTGGGLPFLKDHIWSADGGFRRKMYSGASVELNQRLGFQNSNSNFFDPQDQGTATLSLNYSQPLLRGRGKYVNRSQIMIAQIGQGVAWDQFAAKLQNELLSIVEAYWTLYYRRSVLLQKERNVQRGQSVLDKLEARADLDSLPSQIVRARAAVQARRTELANAVRDVRNAETQLRRLIGSPDAFQTIGPQLLPIEAPLKNLAPEDLQHVITTSMERRPEVLEAMKQAKIATVRRNVSKNELLPELTMMFNTYVSALEGESEVGTAWGRQFDSSTPGYAVGLEFSLPLRNRAARSRWTKQRLELREIQLEIEQVLQDVVAESKISWRQLESSFQTLQAARHSIQAAFADLRQNEVRWDSFALVEGDLADGHSPTTLLDQLLEAQQRLTIAELTYSRAVLDFKVAETQLKKAMGTLLEYQQISFSRDSAPDGPILHIHGGAPDQ